MNSYLGFWRVTRKQFNIRRYAEHKCYTKVCILFLFGPLQNSCVQMWWIFSLLVYTNLVNSYSKCISFRIIFFILNSSSNKQFRHENSTKKSGQQNHRVRWLTSSKSRRALLWHTHCPTFMSENLLILRHLSCLLICNWSPTTLKSNIPHFWPCSHTMVILSNEMFIWLTNVTCKTNTQRPNRYCKVVFSMKNVDCDSTWNVSEINSKAGCLV